jgi:hypothetical protein
MFLIISASEIVFLLLEKKILAQQTVIDPKRYQTNKAKKKFADIFITKSVCF